MLIGFGVDTHQLAAGLKLILGGVEIPASRGALAHSDGDVLLHAVIDSLLGAVGRGDIGDLFPDTDPRYKDISSGELLARVLKDFDKKIVNLDTTIVLDSPKLGEHKAKIKSNLSRLLNAGQVSVKAKTSENCDPDLIRAYAVVLVE